MPDLIARPTCRTRNAGKRCPGPSVYQATVTCPGCSWTTPLGVCTEHAAVVRRPRQPHRCGNCGIPMILLSIRDYPKDRHA